jgi:hypothetical protein
MKQEHSTMVDDMQRIPRREREDGTSAIDLATVPNPGVITGAPPRPVIGVHVIPAGPRYLFQDAEGQETHKRYLVIGAAADCDIRLQDSSISAHHGSIVRKRYRVYVNDLGSTNGVWVAGCRVRSCELHAGTVVTLGNIHMVAISQETVRRDIVIAASTLPEFIRQAVDAYGSIRAAADGIGVPNSTLRDWLRKK